MKLLTRRAFLIGVSGVSLAAGVVILFPSRLWKKWSVHLGHSPWMRSRVFSRQEWRTIGAFGDSVLPGDEAAPSATQAGVLVFLDRLFQEQVPVWALSGVTPAISQKGTYSRFVAYYQKLVLRLQTLSKERFEKTFVNLSEAEREAIIRQISTASKTQVGAQVVGLKPVEQAEDVDLYNLARLHILQGYFAEPRYGGNFDFSAWESVRHICHFNYPADRAPSCPRHVM